MAERSVHVEKAELCWKLANQWVTGKRTEFLCINLVIYTVGHLIEALLAEENRHPACAARGVPHGDRDVLMRKYLVGGKRIEPQWADCYADLVSRRDTFIEGGLPSRQAVETYMRLAEPLVTLLWGLVNASGSGKTATQRGA